MNTCKHTSWLSLHGEENIRFCQGSALTDIVSNLNSPAEKWPSLVVLVGHARQSTMMRQAIMDFGGRTSCATKSGVCLQLDPYTAFSDCPILVAHHHLPGYKVRAPEPERYAPCHRNIFRDLPRMNAGSIEAADELHCGLLHPFADVICLFASDKNETQLVADKLIAWLDLTRRSKWRCLSPPRIIIVCPPNETRKPAMVQEELLSLIRSKSLRADSTFFSLVSVFVVNGSSRTLRDQIRYDTDIVRSIRVQTHSLLNAAHIDFLFHRACDHFVHSSQEPFDPITASRLHRPVAAGLGSSVAALLAEVTSFRDFNNFAIPFIAECLLLDNYTQDVHGRTLFTL